MGRAETMKAIDYLEWYFHNDDGGADKDAVAAFETVEKELQTNHKILLFSDRELLGKEFEKWADECGAMKCWGNFVAFLHSNNFLNIEAIREYVRERKQKEGGRG